MTRPPGPAKASIDLSASQQSDQHPVLVTGAAGFIGANFVHKWLAESTTSVIVLDKHTYAGNRANLAAVANHPRLSIVVDDIGNRPAVRRLLAERRPAAIVNFAAETHVDRSITGPDAFIQTNVVGTFGLLEEARDYWQRLPEPQRSSFRFLHVSTDEVYGSLGPEDPAFSESTPYAPNSPYSASKAASDHLVRAVHHTYGLPTLTTNCSNNYGPYQFPEKLIPLVILNAIQGKQLPVYGDGLNTRDWLYVEDHCEAVMSVLARGRVGEVYNIGGRCEMTNIDLIRLVCQALDEMLPGSEFRPHEQLITHVRDRPGHDRRYAINAAKIERELGWRPRIALAHGIRRTVAWYLANAEWTRIVTSGSYRDWIAANYAGRSA
jgi:dTDP-glucose 4,6-dehydratase